jgi:O-antigen ligase
MGRHGRVSESARVLRPRSEAAESASLILLLVALVYAAVAHGGFHATELVIVVVLIAVALACALRATPLRWSDVGAPTVAAAALAAWYVIAGVAAGHLSGAGPAVGLLFGAAATVAIVRRVDVGGREFVLVGVLVVGALVALCGWIGVAFHRGPWAIEDNGLWRAASTITYANATGGFCGAMALVALDRVVVGVSRRLSAALAMVCLVGLLATASRGAIVGFVVGFALLVGLRHRRHLSHLLAPLLGAAASFGALAPSLPSGHDARPGIAIVGLAAGCAISLAPAGPAIAAAVACAALGFASPTLRHEVGDAWSPISSQRITADSADRAHERRAALQLAEDHLATGVGPGNVTLTWDVYYFVPVRLSVHYAHDEYLQMLVESGTVGLAIAVAGIGAVLLATARNARSAPSRLAAAGIVSALAMLAVHSATDFLWHVPLVPLTMSALIGTLWMQPSATAVLPNVDPRPTD